jgi:oligoribonuclease NrnB/cAMP/cGMP phosphodiesterase (DHH superfamily)
VFDIERSGAGITWDYFWHDTPREPLISYIEDRDLWKFALPMSREINAVINCIGFDYDSFVAMNDRLLHHFESVVSSGQAIMRYREVLVESLAQCAKQTKLLGVPVMVANAPYKLVSEVGHHLTALTGVSMIYHIDDAKGFVKVSLRSADRGVDTIDVSEIAAAYGGGGHMKAAGFQLDSIEALAEILKS